MNKEQKEAIDNIADNEEFAKMWKKLHTPWKLTNKVGRNQICPFCDSNKKFKKCSCYNDYKKNYVW